MKLTLITAALLLCGHAAWAATPSWLEADSAAAIEARTRADFGLTLEEGIKAVKKLHPGITDAQIKDYIDRGYLEVREIDGRKRMHVKSPKNLALVNPMMNGGYVGRTSPKKPARIAYVDTILATLDGKIADGAARHFR